METIISVYHVCRNADHTLHALRAFGYLETKFDYNLINEFLKPKSLWLQKICATGVPRQDLFAVCLWGLSSEQALSFAREYGFQGPFNQKLISDHLSNGHELVLLLDQTSNSFFTKMKEPQSSH